MASVRARKHEWDWPESGWSRQDPEEISIRPRAAMVAPPRRGWAHPTVTRFCDGFFTVVVRCMVGAFAAVVAAIGLGAVWLIMTVLSA